MKSMFNVLRVIVSIISLFVFASGVVLTGLGVYDFVKIFTHLGSDEEHSAARLMAVGLLHAVDFFFSRHCILCSFFGYDAALLPCRCNASTQTPGVA